MNVFIFGNGNLSFSDFVKMYVPPLEKIGFDSEISFSICDFRGVDTLTMEFLKCKTSKVSLYHIGEKPRYFPDKFKTKANEWKLIGGFQTDQERDSAAIEDCTHFLAFDFNSDENRKSGTLRNIEKCLSAGKICLTL